MAKRRDKLQKTNAMRELDAASVPYEARAYDAGEVAGRDYGVSVARALGEDPDAAFKTLVCVTPEGGHVVCCLPVSQEVDLKKAAAAAGEKRLELMAPRDLEQVTGYVRGGCSPVGMRKPFPTIIDEACTLFDVIAVSGGRIGLQLLIEPSALVGFVGAKVVDITRDGV